MRATLAASVVSLCVMLWAIAHYDAWLLWAGTASFALVAILAAYAQDAKNRDGRVGHGAAVDAIAATSRITLLTYAWGGTALLAMYPVAGFWWRHNWQYGAAMLLIAAGLAVYLTRLNQAGSSLRSAPSVSRAVALAWVQGASALTAITWLLGTGKLYTQKNDWAANAVFVCGAAVLTVVSAIVIMTHRRLTRPA